MSAEIIQPKAVLWDLDGTILDSLSVALEIIDETFPQFGLAVLEREELRKEFHGSLESSLLRFSNGYHDQTSLLQAFLQSQPRHYENPVLHTDMYDVIKELRSHGFKQAVVTSRGNISRGPSGAHAIVQKSGMGNFIDVVISADECSAHKPDPKPLEMALARLNVQPQNAVMIGDQPVDVIAAQNAGVHSIIIDHENTADSRNELSKCQPDMLTHSTSELLTYIQKVLGVK